MRVLPPLLRPSLRRNAEPNRAAGFFLKPSTSPARPRSISNAGGGRLGVCIGDAERVKMATTRQITLLLSPHLGVEVAPYAARLAAERTSVTIGDENRFTRGPRGHLPGLQLDTSGSDRLRGNAVPPGDLAAPHLETTINNPLVMRAREELL